MRGWWDRLSVDAGRWLDSARQGNYNYRYEQRKPRVVASSAKYDKAPRWLGFAWRLEGGVCPPLCEFMSRANSPSDKDPLERLPGGINEPASLRALSRTHAPLNQ